MKVQNILIALLLYCILVPLSLVSASVYEETDSAINYTMSYPIVYLDHNQEAQDRINSDIYNYIYAFKAGMACLHADRTADLHLSWH